MFNYLTEKKMFLSKGNIKIIDKRNNEYLFSEIYIDEKKRKIVGSDVKSFFNEEFLKADRETNQDFLLIAVPLMKMELCLKKEYLQLAKIKRAINVLHGPLEQKKSMIVLKKQFTMMALL